MSRRNDHIRPSAPHLAHLLPQVPGAMGGWRAQTPLGNVVIEIGGTGVWTVVLDGFSRSSNRSLRTALGEATGTHHDKLWLRRLAADIESRHVSRLSLADAERDSKSRGRADASARANRA
jgi:hypothetical protein